MKAKTLCFPSCLLEASQVRGVKALVVAGLLPWFKAEAADS